MGVATASVSRGGGQNENETIIGPMPNENLHLAIRRTGTNPDHHLWNNNGTWWCYFTLRSAAGGSKRHRISLKTHDLETARAKRDRFLHAIHTASGHIAA